MNTTISVSVAEVCEELKEDLVAGKFSADDFGVKVGGVCSFEVGSIDGVFIITDKFVKGVVDNGLSLSIN